MTALLARHLTVLALAGVVAVTLMFLVSGTGLALAATLGFLAAFALAFVDRG